MNVEQYQLYNNSIDTNLLAEENFQINTSSLGGRTQSAHTHTYHSRVTSS
jgi:hypothetical protein